MIMELIDSHTHLYLDEFADDRTEVVARAGDADVTKFFLPNIDSSTISPMLKMADDFPGTCYPMMGLHPTSVKENYLEELATVKQWLGKRDFIAVGEIGIDLYWDTTYKREQEDAFEQQLRLALEHDLPVVIHARDSFHEIYDVLDRVWQDGMKGVFHSFTGDLNDVKKIRDYDFYFGLNGILTFKNSGLDRVAPAIPPERIILETDSPFLAPVPRRGRRNESAYVRFVAEKLADILQMNFDDVARLTTANAEQLFNIRN